MTEVVMTKVVITEFNYNCNFISYQVRWLLEEAQDWVDPSHLRLSILWYFPRGKSVVSFIDWSKNYFLLTFVTNFLVKLF